MKKVKPVYFAALVAALAAFFLFEAFSAKHLSYHFSFVGYGGTFQNHELKILGIPIYWFLLLCGFAVTFFVSWSRRKKYRISKWEAVLFPALFLLIAYAGGKLLFILENYAQFRKTGLSLDGMSLYGAIYLVFLTVPLIALCARKSAAAMYDFFTPFGLILLACVRMGCFFNGCCMANTLWSGSTPVILPVQLFEVVCDLLILEFCFEIERKYPFKGYMYPAFLLLYGLCRFLLEFLRNTPKDVASLSHGQVFSLIGIALAAVLYGCLNRKKPKKRK